MKSAKLVWSGLMLAISLAITPLANATEVSVGRATAEPHQNDARAAASNPNWYVVARATNKCDRTQVLRRGTFNGQGGWGYRKIAFKHNLRRIKVWKRVVQGSCGSPEGGVSTTYVYRARILHVICRDGACTPTGEKEIVRLVQQTRNNKGAITMYCEGRIRCPEWINTGYLPRAAASVTYGVRIVPAQS